MTNPGFTDILMSFPAQVASTNAGSLYPARSHAIVRAQLIEAVQQRDGIVVLTGESGVGKTTLSRFVLQSFDPKIFVSEIVDPFVTIDDLLRQVLSDFGRDRPPAAAGASPHDLVLSLGRFLDSMPPEARAVIVVDEAHDVRGEVLAKLRTLANLQRPDGRSLQILLVGQPELHALLARSEMLPIRQRLTRVCRLEPLADGEIGPYVAHRFGGVRGAAFQPDAIRAVAALSRGIPRTVNVLTDRAVEIALERKTRAIGRDVIVESARRLGVRVSIGQRVSARRIAFVVGLGLAAALTAWLLVFKAAPFARTFFVSTPAVGGPPSASNPATRSTPDTASAASPASAPPVAAPPAASLPAALPSPATAPGPAAAPPSATPVPGALPAADSFLVLAGSFKSERNAEGVVDRLTKLRLPAFGRHDGDWNVVLIGPYVTQEEAREAREQVGRDFPDAHVVHLKAADPTK